jgi:AcrR family transcriptional regulator
MREASIRQILDVSEELFSNYGYSGVTIKDVAEKVGVDPALVLYYFDGKQALFDVVCERRMQDAVVSRTKALDEYEALAGDHPTVEGALQAYYDGAFDAYIEGGEGWRNFGRIFAQINNAPGYGAEKMLYFDPVVLRLIEILQRALPGLDREEIFWGFQFTSAAFTQALSRTGRIDRLSGGLCSSDDLRAVRERMSVFMAAGFGALRNRKGQGLSRTSHNTDTKRRRMKPLRQAKPLQNGGRA